MQLNTTALAPPRAHDVTPLEWATRFYGNPTWAGDACGCPDDRCTGYHHDPDDECACLQSFLRE